MFVISEEVGEFWRSISGGYKRYRDRERIWKEEGRGLGKYVKYKKVFFLLLLILFFILLEGIWGYYFDYKLS